MDKDIYFKDAYRDLLEYGFSLSKERIKKFNTVVATKREFSISSKAIYMHVFVIMALSRNITRDTIKDFFECARDYAGEYTGEMEKKLTAEPVCFALLASEDVADDAKQWVLEGMKKFHGAFELPLIFDLENSMLYYCKTPVRPHYLEHFHDLIDYLAGAESI